MSAIGLLVVECMTCRREMRRDIIRADYPEFLLSHGICRRCAFWRRWESTATAASAACFLALFVLAVLEVWL